MNLSFIFILSTIVYASVAHAVGTPFDGFSGEYSVASNECTDLVNQNTYNADIKTITVMASQADREVHILKTGENTNQASTLSEDLGGRFLGDGISSAIWIQSTNETGFIHFLENSFSKDADGVVTFRWEQKYLEQRSNVPPNNIHYRCEFRLAQ